MPIAAGGEPVVQKRISPDGLFRRNNWNTDFAVDRNYASYRINLQSASTEQALFPTSAFLRFTDNSDLRVVNENRTLQPEQRHVFGPFPADPGRRTNQVNVRVGATKMPASTGFSYRVSVGRPMAQPSITPPSLSDPASALRRSNSRSSRLSSASAFSRTRSSRSCNAWVT